jgi:NTE family protein
LRLDGVPFNSILYKNRFIIMQVKSWPLGPKRDWLKGLKFGFFQMSLAAVFLLSGCASVKTPEVIGVKPSGANESSSQVVAPVLTEPVVVPKVLHLGLALGGGAARGFAHVGVIQVLEEAGIQPELVVGTSAGSLVAALYASGKTSAQLKRVAETMEEAEITDWMMPILNRGALRGEALAR